MQVSINETLASMLPGRSYYDPGRVLSGNTVELKDPMFVSLMHEVRSDAYRLKNVRCEVSPAVAKRKTSRETSAHEQLAIV